AMRSWIPPSFMISEGILPAPTTIAVAVVRKADNAACGARLPAATERDSCRGAGGFGAAGLCWDPRGRPLAVADLTVHGASATDAFHVVIPSMPDYVSGEPTSTGWGLSAWAKLGQN